jgi:UDP-glucose 4-epimerase
MSKAVCAVLGGTGFLGRQLCAELVRQQYVVRSISRSGHPPGSPEMWWENVQWIAGDVGSAVSLDAIQDADVLLHLASTTYPYTSNRDPVYDLESNTVATVRMLQSGALSNLRKIIFVSSGGTVYGVPQSIPIDESHPTDPICAYGIHKLACEKYIQLFHFMHKIDYAILRVSNMYGPLHETERPFGAVETFMRRCIQGKAIDIWGDGSTTRDYVHVEDVVASLTKSIEHGSPSGIFNIGSGVGHTLNDLVKMLEQRAGAKVKVNYLPQRNFDVPANVLDISKAKEELGWQPRSNLEWFIGQDKMLGTTTR